MPKTVKSQTTQKHAKEHQLEECYISGLEPKPAILGHLKPI